MLDVDQFPNSRNHPIERTSEKDPFYNCIAWAAGDKSNPWWPQNAEMSAITGSYWPPGVPKREDIKSFVKAFKSIGYSPCGDGQAEPGFVKVAIYALNGVPTHAARQLPDGRWTHKMGQNIDIATTLEAVEGPIYGAVAKFLKKRL